MKALVYTGPQSLSYQDFTTPEPQGDECLVDIEAVGICGSDMHAWLGHDERRPAPLILGHEAAGLAHLSSGSQERVTINPLVTCMQCPVCLDGRTNICSERQILSMPPREGAFAEHLVVPERNLLAVPEGVPMAQAALAEPLACGYHALIKAQQGLHSPFEETTALVLGGGAIGVGAALGLQIMGCTQIHIFEPNPLRTAMLKRAGPFQVHTEAHTLATIQPDLVIDAYGGEPSRATASQVVVPGGVIVHIGLASAMGGLDIRRMTLQEITFIGTYTYTMQDFKDTASLIFAGRYGDFSWMAERDLSEGAAAFHALHAGQIDAAKIVLKP